MAKILLVEDDNNLREIYEARLQAEGYDIVSARDGEEALVVAKSQQPDLVISDVMMPKISGFEMLDIMRNTDSLKNVKVIMLTALGQTEDQTRADSLGADRYLVKSQVTLEDIVNVSQQLLTEAGVIAAPATAEPAPAPAPAEAEAAPAPEPVVEPVAPVEAPTATPEADMPVIPLAAAPPAIDDDLTSLQMPPTPASTIPAEPVVDAAPLDAPAEPQPEPTSPIETAPEVAPAVAETAPAVAEPAEAAPAPTTDEPETSAQESAEVADQIAQFIETQSATPPAAVEPSTTTDAPVAPEVTQPETPPEPVATATDEERQKALNDALTSLGGQTADTATPAAPVADGTAVHKKVISPLGMNDTGKKSFDVLVAEEAARENGTTPPTAPAPVAPAPVAAAPRSMQDVTPAPGAPSAPVTPTAPAPAADEFDPNSIAL